VTRPLIREHFRSDGRPKTAYDTREQAASVSAQTNGATSVYQCSFCGAYHFGNHNQKETRQ
jgi:hypothetical protein